MKIEHPETGEEMEVFTAEEVAEKETLIKEKEEELEKVRAEAEGYKKVSAEKTENFKRLNDMTQEEKEAMSENQIELLKRNEMLEDSINTLKSQVDEGTKMEVESKKSKLLSKYYGDNEELKAKIEENWDLINLDGVDDATLARKAELSAAMAGVTEQTNPLYAPFSGEAPQHTPSTESDQKVDEAAKIAQEAMGITSEEETK